MFRREKRRREDCRRCERWSSSSRPSVVTCPAPPPPPGSQTDRFSSVTVLRCQFSRTSRKETNSSDFVTRLVLFPRRKERDTYLARTCGPHPRRLSGQELLPKTASSMRPFVDSTRFCPHSVPQRSIMNPTLHIPLM